MGLVSVSYIWFLLGLRLSWRWFHRQERIRRNFRRFRGRCLWDFSPIRPRVEAHRRSSICMNRTDAPYCNLRTRKNSFAAEVKKPGSLVNLKPAMVLFGIIYLTLKPIIPVLLMYGVSFGCRGGLIFLRDENLEADSTLRRLIHRLVSEDDCRARCDDFLRLMTQNITFQL
jgi:hypothetical protein